MYFSHITLSYFFISSALFSVFLSLIAFLNKKNPANKSLSLLLALVSIWSLFYGFELLTNNYDHLHDLLSVQYIGISAIPVLLLVFVSRYAERDHWINKRSLFVLMIIPCITFIMVLTNDFHHLFYATSELVNKGNYTYHEFTKGPFYFLHLIYSYSIILFAIYLIFNTYLSVSHENRMRVLFILFSAVIPCMFSLLYIFGFKPEGNVDLTPIGFLIMGLLLTVGTFNKGLLNIKPIVLSSIFKSIPDAILVVDSNGIVISSNPKAIDLMQKGLLGDEKIHEIINSKEFVLNHENNAMYIEIELLTKTFRVEKTDITNLHNKLIGTMFFIIEITQEKQFQDALKKSEEQYRILFDNAQEGIVVIQNMRFVFFNTMLLKMTGYEEKELLNMHYNKLIFNEDIPFIEKNYNSLASGNKIENKLQFRLKGKYGNLCWVEFSSVLIDWNDKPAGLLFVNNINEQKQAEQLKELLISISNTYINAPIENFDATINNSLQEIGMFVNSDRSYIFEYDWEKNTCTNTYEWCAEGITSEINHLKEVPLDDLTFWTERHKNKLPLFIENVSALSDDDHTKQILEQQEIKSLITIPLINEDDCIGFVGFDSVRYQHVYSEKERILLEVFSQMIVNLSNRKKANEFIHQQIKEQQLINLISSEFVSADYKNIESKIKFMLEKTGEFFRVDRSYILRYYEDSEIETNTHEWCANNINSEKDSINHVSLDNFPWWKKQVIKKSIIHISNVNELPDEATIEKNELSRQGIKTLLCFPILNNNTLIGYYGFDVVNSIRNWSKNQINLIEILSNILGDALIKVETEIELIRSKELAEAANVAKSNFLSNMSHEIRTPLNGVIGFTELLRNTSLNNSQKDYLENAITSANLLLEVISDILDFSKIESGKMELEIIKTDIIQLFEDVTDIIKVMASKKGLELLLFIKQGTPRFAYIDPIRIKQVLVNLLSNAVKFTHQGEIELSLEFELKENQKGIFKVKVRDTGIGIKNTDRNKLFKAFSQADTSTTRRYGGTGLGLIISNSLVKKMGGAIEFESEYEKGSVFSFNIECPFEFGEKVDYPKLSNIKRVLIVDDNENNRFILKHTLNYWGIETVDVENGQNAIELLISNNAFDLLIIDYNMPDLDGLETIARIRDIMMNEQVCIPIILLHSSSDDVSLHVKSKDLKIRYLLTKPVKQNELLFYINNVLCDENSSEVVPARKFNENIAPLYTTLERLNILIVEDTLMNMILTSNMVKTIFPNVTILEANNGFEAIQQVKNTVPDIILMDVQMPEMDGLEATRQIRKLEYCSELPIIALTAGVSNEERKLCYQSGMNDFLSKPIEHDELKYMMYKYLASIPENLANHQINTLKDGYDFSSNTAKFDRVKLIEKISDIQTLKLLFDTAKIEYPKYIDNIGKAIDLNNKQLILSEIHKLKGSALNMEFISMSEYAKMIEKEINDIDLVKYYFKLLKNDWNEISGSI